MASSASMFAEALGATAARVSAVDAASSGSEKLLELVRLTLAGGDPRVVPFGP
jgi:hypothetical protein